MKNKYLNRKNLTGIIIAARSYSGLTQARVAKKIGTAQTSISRAEKHGINQISFAERICNACGFHLRFNHITIESLNGKSSHSSFTEEKAK